MVSGEGSSSGASFKWSVVDERSPSALKDLLTAEVRPILGGSPAESEDGNSLRLSWVKHRCYLLGFPFIHSGIIIILLGGLLGTMYGFRGHMVIKEGEVGENFVLQDSREMKRLPFQVAVDKFTLETYESTGRGKRPKEYRSDVRLLEGGKVVAAAPIRVNHPLTFNGLSLYQADYQVVGVKSVELKLTDSDGTSRDFELIPGQAEKVPDTPYLVRLVSLDPGTTPKGIGVDIQVDAEGRQAQRIGVYTKAAPPKLDNWQISFIGYQPRYSTGLQIGYDPGTPLVWTGSLLLCCGFFLTLFTNHRRFWIELTPKGDETHIVLSGRSRRSRREFRESIEATLRKVLGKSGPDTGVRSKE